MSYDERVRDAIIQIARRYGVDPDAALAVAAGEGGIAYGAVGDSGTSFGPFQLHVGGALPAGRDAAWANSPEGLDYAIRKMSEVGASGLRGAPAIDRIIRKFERPADPDTSVRNAIARYGRTNLDGAARSMATMPGENFTTPPPGMFTTPAQFQQAQVQARAPAQFQEGRLSDQPQRQEENAASDRRRTARRKLMESLFSSANSPFQLTGKFHLG